MKPFPERLSEKSPLQILRSGSCAQGNAEGRDESGEQCENLLQLCQQCVMLLPGQQRFFVSAVLFFERLASFCSVILKKRWLRAPLCHRLTALVETHVVNNLSLQTQMVPPRNSCQGITEKMDFCFYLSRGPKKKMGRVYRSGSYAPKQGLNSNIPN